MWEILAYALIAAGSVLSTYFTNKQNRQESDKQRQWQENMMDKQNEYNRMQNQFARSEEAGVNPLAVAMAEGGVSVAGNTSAAPGNYQLPNIMDPMSLLGNSASNLASAFGSAQAGLSDKTFRQARLDQLEEQNNQIRASVKNLNASTEAQLIANKYADQRELWALAGQKAKVTLTYAEVASTNSITRRTEQEIENLLKQSTKLDTEIELNYLSMEDVLAHIESQYADIELKGSQVAVNKAQVGLLEAQTDQAEANTELLENEAELKGQESDRYTELTDKVIEQYNAAIAQIQAETGKTQQEAYWIWFDKVESQSLRLLGSHISQTRFGRRKLRKVADRMIKETKPY